MSHLPSSFEDAKTYVRQVLEKNSSLAAIQADIRKQVSLAVLDDRPFPKTKTLHKDSPQALKVTHLVSEWLSFYGFQHTASVLNAEAALQDTSSRDDLISAYSLPSSPSEPLLLTLLSSLDAGVTLPPPESTPTEVKEVLSVSKSSEEEKSSPEHVRSVSPPIHYSSPSPFSPVAGDLERNSPVEISNEQSVADVLPSTPSPPSAHPSPLPPSPLPKEMQEEEEEKVDSFLFLRSASASSNNNTVSGEMKGSGLKSLPPLEKSPASLPELKVVKQSPKESVKNALDFDLDVNFSDFSDFSDDDGVTPTAKLNALNKGIKKLEEENGVSESLDSLTTSIGSKIPVVSDAKSADFNQSNMIDLDDIPSFDSVSDLSDDDFS
ncbi:hypothetical protein P9112_004258 [Eukaryota sp. TZLM1-RC]